MLDPVEVYLPRYPPSAVAPRRRFSKTTVFLEDFTRKRFLGAALGGPFGVQLLFLGLAFGVSFGAPFWVPFWVPSLLNSLLNGGPKAPPRGPFPKGALRIVFVFELPTAGAKSGGG